MSAGHFWIFIFGAASVGAVLGATFALRILESRHRRGRVLLERELRESRDTCQRERRRHEKVLRQAVEKQEALRTALAESEETARLLSAEQAPAWRDEIEHRIQRIGELEKLLVRARARADDAEDHAATLEQSARDLREELELRDRRVDELLNRNAEFHGLREITAEQEERCSRLQAALDQAMAQKQELDAQLVNDRTRNASADSSGGAGEAERHEHNERIADLGQQFEDMRHRLPALNDALRERESAIDDLVNELSRERQRSLLLEQRLAHTQSRSTEAPPARPTARVISIHGHPANALRLVERDRPAEADNLQRIRGIGPVLERTLNELGIYRYEQVAALTTDDIRRLEQRDHSLPGRLRRYDWISQAERLDRSGRSNRTPGA